MQDLHLQLTTRNKEMQQTTERIMTPWFVPMRPQPTERKKIRSVNLTTEDMLDEASCLGLVQVQGEELEPRSPRPLPTFFGFPSHPVPPRLVRTVHVLTQHVCRLPTREQLEGFHSEVDAMPSTGASSSDITVPAAQPASEQPKLRISPIQSSRLVNLTVAALLPATADETGNSRTNAIDTQALIACMQHILDTEPEYTNTALPAALTLSLESKTAPAPLTGKTVEEHHIPDSPRAASASTSSVDLEGGRQLSLCELGFRATKRPRITPGQLSNKSVQHVTKHSQQHDGDSSRLGE